jgi:hypothetical protein
MAFNEKIRGRWQKKKKIRNLNKGNINEIPCEMSLTLPAVGSLKCCHASLAAEPFSQTSAAWYLFCS